ncbi:hypothetical protein EDD37DRAFT_449423 [Exophiala viscosa]|uniref:uncharacterized protein n=1 Tax=Exophiala viscosa TaxID=2486360 RepID=UPI00218D99F1|nr:hypothetical protein EDD37DRAFT_449423 [Exophiala viscosa]
MTWRVHLGRLKNVLGLRGAWMCSSSLVVAGHVIESNCDLLKGPSRERKLGHQGQLRCAFRLRLRHRRGLPWVPRHLPRIFLPTCPTCRITHHCHFLIFHDCACAMPLQTPSIHSLPLRLKKSERA